MVSDKALGIWNSARERNMLPISWYSIFTSCSIQFIVLLRSPSLKQYDRKSSGVIMAGICILLGLYPTLISSFCAGCLEQGTRGLWKVWGFSMWFVTIPMVVFQYAGTITDDSVTESHFKSIYPFYGPVATKIALYFSAILFLFLVYTAKDAKQHQKLGNHLSVLVAQEMSDGIEMLDEREGISKELKFTILISVTLFFCLLPLDVCRETAHIHGNDREQLAAVRTLIKVVCVNCVFIAIRLFIWWKHGREGVIFCFKNAICTIICLREVYSVFATKQPVREMIQIV